MREKLESRCGRHCLKLGDDGGSCNAIVYNRESKVSFYKIAKLPLNHNFTTSQISLFWGQTRITKKIWIKVCFMGEGRLVAGSPTVDTGLRVAWSRFSNIEQAITFKIIIFSPNKTGFVGAKWQKINLPSSTYTNLGFKFSAWFAVDRKTQNEMFTFFDLFHRFWMTPFKNNIIFT